MPPAPPRAPATSQRLGTWLFLSLLAANLAVLGISFWAVHASLQLHRLQAEVSTRNLAGILEQNLAGRIRLLDLTLLQGLDDPLLARSTAPSPAEFQQLLEHHRARLPHLGALRITDAEGHVIGGTHVQELQATTIADRPYFQALKARPEAGLLVSPPVVSRFDQTLVLIFARARLDAAGRFAGILYGVVPLEAFTQALGMVDIGPQGSIAVRDGEHRLITRFPSRPETQQRVGERTDTPEYLRIVQSGHGVGTFRKASPVDGLVRTWTVRRVAEQPLWLVVGLAEVDYLQPWKQERLKAAATVLGSLLISILLGRLVLGAWRRQVEAQGELALEKEKFQVLTEQTDDVIWAMDAQERFTYVSPSILRQLGYAPEAFLNMHPQDVLAAPEAQGSLQDLWRRLAACPPGAQPFPREGMVLEHRRKDGTTFTAEVRITVLWAPGGQLLGFRGITRDITAWKRAQQEREVAIQALTQALTEVKELKGLLPICSACKKIRDDQGYWSQMETYISQHTDATFTHGLCPDCARDFFPRDSKPRGDAG